MNHKLKSLEDLSVFEPAVTLTDPVPVGKAPSPAPARPIRIAIVDGDSDSRNCLSKIITQDARYHIVGICPDANSALMSLPDFTPDIVFIELNLPDMDGLRCLRRLRAKLPGTRMIMWTNCLAEARVIEALIDGVSGYIHKHTPGQRILGTIAEVHQGGVSLSPEITLLVVQRLLQNPALPVDRVRLTPRERSVLEQLSQGFRYKDIVHNLGISLGTLHSYISKVYEKLHVHSRTEAVVKYLNL